MEIQHGPGLSPWKPPSQAERRRRLLLAGVRYGLPAVIFAAGLVVLVAASDRDTALEIGFMFFGAAIAVLMLNFFYRMGVKGDLDRDREEEARAYFDRYGRWPDS